MHHCIRHLLIVSGVSFFVSFAFGDGENLYKTPQVIAVQSRGYTLVNEITLNAAYMPLDSFNRYLSYGGSFTHYFNGFEAWEILNVNKAINYDTGLTGQLQQSFGVSTLAFNTLDYYATTNFVYTPLFNKSLWGTDKIIKGETALVLGGGIAKFDNGFTNVIDAGAIFRFFIWNTVSMKFDFRYNFYLAQNTQNNISIGAGLSYSFGAGPQDDLPKEKEKEKDADD
jgi:hypothetical protein